MSSSGQCASPAEVLESSRATWRSVQRLSERIEAVVDDLVHPVRSAARSRAPDSVEDPVLERLPRTLEILRIVPPVCGGLDRQSGSPDGVAKTTTFRRRAASACSAQLNPAQ